MLHKHPLENPSLAPYGLTTSVCRQRLGYKSVTDFWTNAERVIARMWDKHNRANAQRPLPVETIVHTVLPGLARVHTLARGDFLFGGKPYLTRDIVVLSSIVQWFGTSVGDCFLAEDISGEGIKGYTPAREFRIKHARACSNFVRDRDMVLFWTHSCNKECKPTTGFMGGCCYIPEDVSVRDRAVADALMYWLGTRAGRGFIAAYRARLCRVRKAADERRHKLIEARERAA